MKPRVLRVGAGLGGPAAAVASAQSSKLSILVLDSAQDLGEIGAGIQLSPSATKLLRRWDCVKYLEDSVVTPASTKVLRWQDDRVLMERVMVPSMEERYGAPYWHIHQADLHTALLKRCQELEVEVRTDSKVTAVESSGGEDDSVRAVLASGEFLECDFLIGADGIHLKVRDSICRRMIPQATGDLAYRFTIPINQIANTPELAELASLPVTRSWWGSGQHFVGYMLRGGSIFNAVAVFSDDGPITSWSNARGDLQHLEQLFGDWCPD